LRRRLPCGLPLRCCQITTIQTRELVIRVGA
jgi:hypothetical protein